MLISYIVATVCVFSIIISTAPPITAPTITGTTPLRSTSFIVSWTITDPDHNYIVTWTNMCPGMMDSMNMTVPENTNSHMVTGLDGVSNYIVSVTANNSCGMMMSNQLIGYGRIYVMCIYICTYIFNVHFLPPPNGYNNRLTVHLCTVAKRSTDCFTEAPFFSLSDIFESLCGIKIAPSSLDK